MIEYALEVARTNVINMEGTLTISMERSKQRKAHLDLLKGMALVDEYNAILQTPVTVPPNEYTKNTPLQFFVEYVVK